MTIQLNRAEFQRLTNVLQSHSEFGSARDRRRLVEGALLGSNKANVILSRIDFDGNPMGVATEVIKFLTDFGQIEPGKEALGVFLDHLLVNMGISEEADFLANLIVSHSLIVPVLTSALESVPSPEKHSDSESLFVFISYARPEQIIAEQLEMFLAKAGIRTFRDVSNIPAGVNWDMTIEKFLDETTHMVLLLSASSMPYRKEVYREWFFYDQKGKPLYPLYVQDCLLHSRLLSYNYVDGRSSLATAFQKILAGLIR